MEAFLYLYQTLEDRNSFQELHLLTQNNPNNRAGMKRHHNQLQNSRSFHNTHRNWNDVISEVFHFSATPLPTRHPVLRRTSLHRQRPLVHYIVPFDAHKQRIVLFILAQPTFVDDALSLKSIMMCIQIYITRDWWRQGIPWLLKSSGTNLITVQQDATFSVYYFSVGSSTCFGCWHPSSGARTTVIAASGID